MADAKNGDGDHGNGDAKKRQVYVMSHAELMRYVDDPSWVRRRWAVFILYWAFALIMLLAALIIIFTTPQCAPSLRKHWFEEQAFADVSDKEWTDGKLDKDLLKRSNVGGVFTHTAICGSDAYEVLKTPPPACLDQFKLFAAKAKDNGIKVVVDLVANWVLVTHEWFALSEKRTALYEDFFIWGKPNGFNGTVPNPPNNWVSLTNEPAWGFSVPRNEFYLHQYGSGKADLNFTNPAVVNKFDEVLKTWMQAGAAGVRLSHACQLLVSSTLTDEKPLAATDPQRAGAPARFDYSSYRHKHASDRPEFDALLAHFSQVVDDHYVKPGANESVFTLKESGSRPELYLLARSLSMLRPPSAAPLSAAESALLVNKTRERLGPDTYTNNKQVPSDDVWVPSQSAVGLRSCRAPPRRSNSEKRRSV